MGFNSTSPAANASWPYVVFDSGLYYHFSSQWGLTCFLDNEGASTQKQEGARISAIFVVLIVSTCFTLFPVLATKQKKVKIPFYVYLFARYFGSGVITATAFIHLLDPAYDEIGPASCVGMNPAAGDYSWPPAIALASALLVFFMDFAADRYVEKKYGVSHESNQNPQAVSYARSGSVDEGMLAYSMGRRPTVPHNHGGGDANGDMVPTSDAVAAPMENKEATNYEDDHESSFSEEKDRAAEVAFQQQIAAFLILEFGVIFHSVIIGLTLGSAAPSDFDSLYPVIVFHQSFEGLGVGARLSAIPFPRRLRWLPWVLVIAYGLTTPISTAIGIGIGHTYNPTSYTANVVSGILDSFSAGILVYTGLVELLARDFIFNPERPDDAKQLTFMSISVLLGAGIMALLGKWA